MSKEPYEISLWTDIKREQGKINSINLTFPYQFDKSLLTRPENIGDWQKYYEDNYNKKDSRGPWYLKQWLRSTYAAEDRIYHGGNEDGYARINRIDLNDIEWIGKEDGSYIQQVGKRKTFMRLQGFARDDSFYNRLDNVASYEINPNAKKDDKKYVFNGIKAGDMYVFRYRAGSIENDSFVFSDNLFLRPIIAPAWEGISKKTGNLEILTDQQEGDGMILTREYQSLSEWHKKDKFGNDYMQCIMIAKQDISREQFIGFEDVKGWQSTGEVDDDPTRILDTIDNNPFRLWIKIQPQMQSWGRYYDKDDPLYQNENANSKFLIKDFAIEYMEFFKMEVDEKGQLIEPLLNFEDYPQAYENKYNSWYEEEKFCVIGSDTMESTSRATEPKLERDNKGQNTLSFKMYTRCHDNGEDYENPFLPYIHNEGKVKCKWQNKWYDFVIKSIDRKSEDNSIIVTCKDQYINELSRTGFDITLNTKLENNMGTANELVEKALLHSGWTLDEDSEEIQQKTIERVFVTTALRNFVATFDKEVGINYGDQIDKDVVIQKNSQVLLYYSCPITNNPYCSFLYRGQDSKTWELEEQGKQKVKIGLQQDETQVCAQYSFDNAIYKKVDDSNIWIYSQDDLVNPIFKINITTDISPNLQGARLVRKQISKYDSLSDRYMEIFEMGDDKTNYVTWDGSFPEFYAEKSSEDMPEINNLVLWFNDKARHCYLHPVEDYIPAYQGLCTAVRSPGVNIGDGLSSPHHQVWSKATFKLTGPGLKQGNNQFFIPVDLATFYSTSFRLPFDKKNQGADGFIFRASIQNYKKDKDEAAQEQISFDLEIKNGNNNRILFVCPKDHYLSTEGDWYLSLYIHGKQFGQSGKLEVNYYNYSAGYDIYFPSVDEPHEVRYCSSIQTKDATIVQNFITNSTNFSSTDGWYYLDKNNNTSENQAIIATRDWTGDITNPSANFGIYYGPTDYPWLKIGYGGSDPDNPPFVYNAAMASIPQAFEDGIKQGDKYILRLCAAHLGSLTKREDGQTYRSFLDNKSWKSRILNKNTIKEWIEPGIYSFQTTYPNYMQYGNSSIDYNSLDLIQTFNEPIQSTKQTIYKVEGKNSWEDQGWTWVEYEITFNENISTNNLTNFSTNSYQIGTQAPSKYYGLFFKILKGNLNDEFAIQNIEFFPKIENKKANIASKQASYIEPDWIDTTSVIETTYYYYDYTDQIIDKKISDIQNLSYLYVGTEPWKDIPIRPVYNENKEKNIKFLAVSSIEAKQSNHYNILQSIAEKFQCYLEFNIAHTKDGHLIYDPQSHLPKKTIKIKRINGQDTGLSFIYGLDLKSIQRTIKSDSITTKTYVLPNSNEFGENGICTIERCKNNYSGEKYILNFDYFVETGLINAVDLLNDLYRPSGGSMGYYIRTKYYNDLITYTTQLYNLKLNTYKVTEAKSDLLKTYLKKSAEEQRDAWNDLNSYAEITSWKIPIDECITYDETKGIMIWPKVSATDSSGKIIDVTYHLEYINNEGVERDFIVSNATQVSSDPKINGLVKITPGTGKTIEKFEPLKGYVSYNSVPRTSGVTAGNKLVDWEDSWYIYDYTGEIDTESSLRRWANIWYQRAYYNNTTRKILTKDIFIIETLQKIIDEYSPKVRPMEEVLFSLGQEIKILDQLNNSIRESKNELYYDFHQKYHNFLQEGQWSSEDYYDDTLYYYDGMNVAYESSRPKIEYTFDVLRISSLEGYELKQFDINDYAFIEDKEFFGTYQKDGVLTPWKEKVIITGITYNFDNPSKDVYKVQNYRTQFEDLFQRTIATVQSLKYAEGDYNRAASQFATNGTITTQALQASLNSNLSIKIGNQNNQVLSDATGFRTVNPFNSGAWSKNFGGDLYKTTDGGLNWVNYLSAANNQINIASGTLIDNTGLTTEKIQKMFSNWEGTQ